MRESSIMKAIQIAVSGTGTRLFRNNVGRVRDFEGRYIQFGLCPGSSDLIGWRPIKVTSDMVGRTIAIFVAIEVKKPAGHVTPEQVNFIETVQAAGGIGAVSHSKEEALDALKQK